LVAFVKSIFFMVGEGGAFLFLLVTFSQDSHDFSQRWEKMRDF